MQTALQHRMAICLLLAGIIACLLAGCATSNKPGLPPSFAAPPHQSRYAREIAKLEREGQRNWVLNLNELAVKAMRNGDHDIARQALDEAILQIEVIYGDDPRARRARSLFYAEDSKIFKGDPYERSMTYFYRGVLYMQDREWDNARACFRSAIIMDAFAEDEQYRGDWALFDYLIGVCEVQLRRATQARETFALASANYRGFRDIYPTLSPRGDGNAVSAAGYSLWDGLQPFPPEANLLVLTQHGRGPRKLAAGTQGQLLTYAPGPGGSDAAVIALNGTPVGPPQITDSIYFQASTRGGRELDAILGRQAFFKDVTGTVGDIGLMAGTVVLLDGLDDEDNGQAVVGAGILAAGLVAYGLSSLAQSRADTRAWKSLPDALGFMPIRTQAGNHTIEVRYANESAVADVYLPEAGEGLVVALSFPGPNPSLLVPSTNTRSIPTMVLTSN